MNKNPFPYKIITAITCITLLEALAIWQGINGAVFGIAIAAIAGLGGYEVARRKKS